MRLFGDFDEPFSLHASAAREELFFPQDVLDPRIDELIDNYMLWRQYEVDKDDDDDIRDSNLEENPDRVRKNLGEDADLILGYHPRKEVKLEFALDAFVPGDAFDSDAENAYFGAFEVRFKF